MTSVSPTIARMEKVLTWLVFSIVILTPLFYFSRAAYPYVVPKTLLFQALVEIFFFLWIACAFFDTRLRPKRSLLLLAICVFIVALFITSFTGEDVSRSMWGLEERMLGVVGILHFGMFFVALQSFRALIPWKKLWYASLAVAGFASIAALLQLAYPNLLLEEQVGTRPGSFFGNPTFLAVYLLIHVFVGIWWAAEALRSARGNGRYGKVWVLVGVTLFLALMLFITQTRGDLLGFALGILTLLIFFTFRPPEGLGGIWGSRKFYAGVFAALMLFGGVFFMTRDAALWDAVPGMRRLGSLSLSDETLFPRLTALKVAWNGFLERPLVGWGWDNFNLYFNTHYDPDLLSFGYQETRFDKPHNLFLEYLFSGGLFLFGALAFLITALFLSIFRIKDRVLRSLLVAALVAYLVRSAFIFDTVSSLLIFVLFVAYAECASHTDEEVPRLTPSSRNLSSSGVALVAGGMLVLALFPVYVLNIRSFQAARNQYQGFVYARAGKWQLAREHFVRMRSAWTPWAPSMTRDYAQLTVNSYFLQGDCDSAVNPSCVAPNEVKKALDALEHISRAHPKDAYYHYALLDLYNLVLRLDPGEYIARAEEHAQLALERSPNRQQIYFSLAKTKLDQRKRTEAVALLEQGIALNPKVPDGHFYLGITLFDGGSAARGYEEVQKAITLGKRWVSPSEPRVAADFFVDMGRAKEAVPLYQAAIALHAGDVDAKAGLVIALFRAGDKVRARTALVELVGVVDVAKLPRYMDLAPVMRALGVK